MGKKTNHDRLYKICQNYRQQDRQRQSPQQNFDELRGI